MGAIVYDEFVSTYTTIQDDLAALLDTSTDWSALPSWAGSGLEATALTSGYAAGSTPSMSVTGATGSSRFDIGDVVILARGTAREEVVTLGAVSSSTLTPGTALAFEKLSSDTVERWHTRTMRCLAPSGAELVVEFGGHGDATVIDTRHMAVTIYRTWDGSAGVDPKVLWLKWNAEGSAIPSNSPIHVIMSAGPGFLFLRALGPHLGETGAGTGANQKLDVLFLDEVVVYDDTDTATPVCGGSGSITSSTRTHLSYVSRSADDSVTWAPALLASLTVPSASGSSTSVGVSVNPELPGGGRAVWPYVVSEVVQGVRGRLKRLFFASFTSWTSGIQPVTYDIPGNLLDLDGITYLAVAVSHADTSPLGIGAANNIAIALVPIAGTPA